MNEELAWIDRYLLGEEKEVNEACDKISPLTYGLKKSETANQISYSLLSLRHGFP